MSAVCSLSCDRFDAKLGALERGKLGVCGHTMSCFGGAAWPGVDQCAMWFFVLVYKLYARWLFGAWHQFYDHLVQSSYQYEPCVAH